MRLIDLQASQTQMSFTRRMLGARLVGGNAVSRGRDQAAVGAAPRRRYSGTVTSPRHPRPTRPVEYKGEPLDAERGPGLGCFWFQMVLLVGADRPDAAVAVAWNWPIWVSRRCCSSSMILLLLLAARR